MTSVIYLSKSNLRKALVGTVVVTSKDYAFELFNRDNGKEAWVDRETGLVWYAKEELTYTHYQAVEKFGNRLPTIEEFKEAEKHGIMEVMPDFEGYYFWSSSLNPTDSDFARGFGGSGDSSSLGYRGYDDSVRCVGGRRELKVGV